MSDSVSLQEITDFTEALAREAGELIRHEREENTLRTDYKHQTELVTHADVMADEFITGTIRERFPHHRILSEETMPDLSQAEELETPLWIVDPIDGTVNYAYGHPQVAVSIAYAEKGKVRVGVVHRRGPMGGPWVPISSRSTWHRDETHVPMGPAHIPLRSGKRSKIETTIFTHIRIWI